MIFTWDPKLSVAYMQFGDDSGQVADSHKITDDIVIDVDSNGKVFGIELLNANEQLKKRDGKFQFVNSLTKEQCEVLLPVP
jgi:uncharacterized protein YuzE